MKLIVSDRPLTLAEPACRDIQVIDLSALRIANCVGCFGCWTKTPGKCVIRDDAVRVYPCIAASEKLMYVSKIRYGSYDSIMKTMLERAIPVQQAFIRLHHGETHHFQRRVAPKQAVIIGYGADSDEERAVFEKLVARNARNMNFESWRVIFAPEHGLEQAVEREVLAWEKS